MGIRISKESRPTFQMRSKRPMFWALLGCVPGIVLAAWFHEANAWWSLGLSSLALIGWMARRGKSGAALLLGLSIGALYYSRANHLLKPDQVYDLRSLVSKGPQILSLSGRLLETPVVKSRKTKTGETSNSRALIEVESVADMEGRKSKASGKVMTRTRGTLTSPFHSGQKVEVIGVLDVPPGARAPGLFNYRRYLSYESVHHLLEVEDVKDWKVVGAPTRSPLSDRFLSWGRKVLTLGLPGVDEYVELEWAMTLGWKPGLTEELSEPFMQSGTMHIFAISGLHIVLIAEILLNLLRLARLTRSTTGLLVIPLLWIYTGCTGWQSSAVRASLMMTIIIAGWMLRRPSDLINSLAGAALIILIWEPLQLFQASFQLSFVVVWTLGLLLEPLAKIFPRWPDPDAFLIRECWTDWAKRRAAIGRYIKADLAVAIASWIGSLPLCAWYFNLVTPSGLLANLVVVPLSTAALASNLGGLVTNYWCPFLTELFNHSAWICMKGMVGVTRVTASWTGGHFYVPPPTTGMIVWYFAAVWAVGSGWVMRLPQRRWAWGFLVCSGVAVLAHAWKATEAPRLHLLADRGAQIGIADYRGRAKDLLIDCGDADTSDRLTTPFLRAQGFNRIGSMALTHGDVRHVGGALDIHTNFGIRNVGLSQVPYRSTVFRRVCNGLKDLHVTLDPLAPGEDFLHWKVLSPELGSKLTRADDNAMVLKGRFGDFHILWMGDLSRAGQEELMRHPTPQLRADLLIMGVSMDGEYLSLDLLRKVHPTLVIVMDTSYPVNERAGDAIVHPLRQSGIRALFLHRTGGLTLSFLENELRILNSEGYVTSLRLFKGVPTENKQARNLSE